jgi:subtilisin family serine protease
MKRMVGPLLRHALDRIERAPDRRQARLIASRVGDGAKLPVVVQIPPIPAREGETWEEFRERAERRLEPLLAPGRTPLLAANAVQASLTPEEITRLRGVRWIELDPVVQLASMDDAAEDVGLQDYREQHPGGEGQGVRVAVLDSGVDRHHPHLKVARSVTACDEAASIPGSHGTHCAGSIASRDGIYGGIAPRVTLLNIKVLRADGTGRHTFVTKGIDLALDLKAHVLSISIGFNHLPTWSDGGHGWTCRKGHCPLCTAVDNATVLGNAVVVVAAGNEHEHAEALRRWGDEESFDTELGCPGQARGALTVAAMTKRIFKPAPFSSHGPTADGRRKPDLMAPGVNITSTVPVPRRKDGKPYKRPARSRLFGRKSGTSMATPIVAGAVALLIQEHLDGKTPYRAAKLPRLLLRQAVAKTLYPPLIAGAGRLDLRP